MTISKEILDELLKGVERPEDLLGDAGLMKFGTVRVAMNDPVDHSSEQTGGALKIRLMERMLGAELTAHLGYEEGKDTPAGQASRRNGTSRKAPCVREVVRCFIFSLILGWAG